jgi:hypothetical protein
MKKYKTEKWNGLKNFCCSFCRFKTLDEELMKEHVKSHPVKLRGKADEVTKGQENDV